MMRTDPTSSRRFTRRRFLRRAAAAGAALAAPRYVAAEVLGRAGSAGANEQVRIGVIGVGIRGKYLIGNLPDEARVAALCDTYRPRMEFALKHESASVYAQPLSRFRRRDARRCRLYQDYRRLLDDPRLDAVVIATPDHHHVLAAMLACQAGLDVYCEKCLTLTIREGRRLVEMVRRTGRVLQVGSQQRTMAMNQFACRLIRQGGLGKISLVQLPNYPGPLRYEGLPEEPIPRGLAWDLFLGPTPQRPHNRMLWMKEEFEVDGKLWRGWDMYRAYSGHLMTNWGAHSIDMVQLALGADHTGPVEVWPLADRGQGPMRLCPVAMRYADGVELRLELPLPGRNVWLFHGERGRMRMNRNRFSTSPPGLAQGGPDPEEEQARWAGPGHVARPHLENWLDCVKTRRQPNAPVEAGHRTATVCHLAGLARELGRRLRWDPRNERFLGDEEANQLLDRPRRRGFELPS